MILSLDPSSTCIGYALFGNSGTLAEFGRIKPVRASDSAWVRAQTMAGEVLDMVTNDGGIIARPICKVLIEIPCGKVARRIRGASNGAGLSVYGLAVGLVAGRLIQASEIAIGMDPVEVIGIDNQRWTRGVSKVARIKSVAARVKGYRVENDPGGDVADAIALGEWWFMEQKLAAATAGKDARHG